MIKTQIENNIIKPKANFYNPAYQSASYFDRFLKQWFPLLQSADDETLHNLPALRSRSRDLYRNGTIGRGALRNMATAVIGTGLKLQSNIDREFLQINDEAADQWETTVERLFANWAESKEADYERRLNFYQIQFLTYLARLQSGDSFLVLRDEEREFSIYNLRLQILEADSVANPAASVNNNRLKDGIEFNEKNQPSIYHVKKGGNFASFEKIPTIGRTSGRRNIIHFYEMERPGASRGVPFLTPIMKIIKQRDRLTESELAAAVVQSYLTLIIKSNNPDTLDDPLISDNTYNETSTDVNKDDLDWRLAPGAILQLEDGQDAIPFNPLRPNSAYDAFSTALLKEIAIGQNIPFEILAKQFNSSFTASRAARIEFKKTVMIERDKVRLDICQPIYKEFLTDLILSGRISAPGFFDDPEIQAAWLRAKFTGDSLGHIQEMVEVNAAEKRINMGLSTHQEETTLMNGGDWKKNVIKLKKEKQLINDTVIKEDQL